MSLASESVQAKMRRSDQPQTALGAAIRQLRQKRGITQEDLAHDAEITTGTLSLIERGHANPTWNTVKGIASALGVSMGELGKLSDRLD
jgi:transcriptional regulator with XRE-family HTH domain